MALVSKAGTIGTPASGATQVTGLGFRPGAIILWTENATASNVASGGLDVSFGFWCRPRPSVATRAQSMWVGSGNALAASNAAGTIDQSRPISNRSWNVGSIVERVDNDGFTINYATFPPAATRIHYLALSTDALAQIITLQVPANATLGTKFPVRGVGFAPTGVLAICATPANPSIQNLGFGAAGKMAEQWSMCGATLTNADPTQTYRRWNESNIVALNNHVGGTMGALQLTGYNPDGLDLQVTEAFGAAGAWVFLLCLGNVNTTAGVSSKPTAAAPAAQTITTGFAPKGILFAGTHQAAAGYVASYRGWMGAAAGAVLGQASGAWSDTNAVGTTETRGLARVDVTHIKADSGTLVQSADATTALTSTGATVTWNPNDGVATRVGHFAIGNVQHPVGGLVAIPTYAETRQFWKPDRLGGVSESPTAAEGSIRPNNILGGDVSVPTATSGILALRHTIGGDASIDTAPSSYLAVGHRIAGEITIPTDAETLNFWIPDPLGGDVEIATDAESRITLKHRVGSDVSIPTEASAYFTYTLPFVREQIAGREISGTVNMHENPGAEDGLQGWYAEGGATIQEEVINVWEGARGVRVNLPGLASNEGFYIRSVAGTDMTGASHSIYGSVFAVADGITVNVYSKAIYTDGTYDTSTALTAIPLTALPDWQRLIAVPVETNPAKKLAWVETHFYTDVAQAGTIYADGAQIEEDRGDGPTQWASGGYGDAIGAWAGVPHRSVTVRQPTLIQRAAVGRGGHYEIDVQMWRMTWDNQKVENISRYITSGNVTCDPSRDVTWSINCTMLREGWKKLDENYDWIAPFLTMRWEDGRTATRQLGLYFVVPSEQEREEHRGIVRLNAFDPLWLVARQGFSGNLIALPGGDKGKTIRLIIDGAVLTGGEEEEPGGKRRYYIPDAGLDWKHYKEWPRDRNRLLTSNEIARSAAFYKLFTNSHGFITTRDRSETRLKQRQPVRAWAAHVPNGYVLPSYMPQDIAELPHEIIGKIPTVPKATDLFDEIILVNDDPDRGRIYVKGRVKGKNGRHPRVVGGRKGRHRARRLTVPYLDDEATAEKLARVLADELSALTEYTTITVLPDPRVDYTHETVATAIWDMYGDVVAVGHWRVGRVQYNLWPTSPRMILELSRIHHGDDDVDIEVEIQSGIAA